MSEYKYYNRHNGMWDDTACQERLRQQQESGEYQPKKRFSYFGGSDNDNNNAESDSTSTPPRCVPMNCHEPDTHYTLLGYFKEPYYQNWMDKEMVYQSGYCRAPLRLLGLDFRSWRQANNFLLTVGTGLRSGLSV